MEDELEHNPVREAQGDPSAVLSDLVRWIAIVAAPHGYVATVRMLAEARGNRLLLQARGTPVGHEYMQEISLESLEKLGAVAVGSAFDRAARAAFAAADGTAQSISRPA